MYVHLIRLATQWVEAKRRGAAGPGFSLQVCVPLRWEARPLTLGPELCSGSGKARSAASIIPSLKTEDLQHGRAERSEVGAWLWE